MRIMKRGVLAVSLVMLGYVLGVHGVFAPAASLAQEASAGVSKETMEKVKGATDGLSTAMAALQQEKAYVPAILGVNAFATTVGGVDAMNDLETGRGVDPETFAGLYAGQAVAEVAEHLGKDEEGRVTYKNKVVRMYSISRLKELFAKRAQQTAVEKETK
jgi:hypothetical protein